MSEFLLVIGCAQGRVRDLYHLFAVAKRNYGFGSLLICQTGTEIDEQQCDRVIYTDLTDSAKMVQVAEQLMALDIATGVIFSDSATRHGPKLLHSLNLLDAELDHCTTGNDKFEFRKREAELKEEAPNYSYAPGFQELSTVSEVAELLGRYPNGIILKPKSEAGSRGVSRIRCHEEITDAFLNAEVFSTNGLVAEELLTITQEFSFDGVGDTCFVTAKIVANGRFPVEIGQLVPAPVTEQLREKIAGMGRWMNRLASPMATAFHNEIGLLASDEEGSPYLAAIESNQRPAGMKIWTLAEKVFARDFYEYWLESRLGVAVEQVELTANGSALTIMLGVEEGCVINHSVYADQIETAFTSACQDVGLNLFDFEWYENGLILGREARSNAEFAAQACMHSSSAISDINAVFGQVQALWQSVLSDYIERREVA